MTQKAAEPSAAAAGRLIPSTLTGEQLAGVFGGSFGFTAKGRPNISRTAAAFRCSRSTVYRWLSHRSDTPARIPEKRLRELLAAGRPAERNFAQERLDWERATEALDLVAHPTSRRSREWAAELRMWEGRGWLEPHYVAVIAHPAIGLVGLATPRAEDHLLQRASAGGTVRARITVDNRFAARLVLAQVLAQVDPWRFIPAAMPYGNLRRTWLWLDGIEARLMEAADAAGVAVSEFAVAEEPPPAESPPGLSGEISDARKEMSAP